MSKYPNKDCNYLKDNGKCEISGSSCYRWGNNSICKIKRFIEKKDDKIEKLMKLIERYEDFLIWHFSSDKFMEDEEIIPEEIEKMREELGME